VELEFASATLRFLWHGSVWRALNISLEECYQETQRVDSHIAISTDRETKQGFSMVHLILNLRKWQQSSDQIQIWPSGLALVCRDLLATVPSDKVYGLGGLIGLSCSFGHESPLHVDYSLSPTEVYMKFTFWCIQQENSLDILAQQRYTNGRRRIGQDNRTQDLPSWATDWTAPKLSGSDVIRTRDFVSTLDKSISNLPRPRPVCSRDGRNLIVRGYVIDTVSEWAVGIEVNELKQRALHRWLEMIPGDMQSNLLLFGAAKPTIETLEKLYEQTLAKDSSILYLWREVRVSEGHMDDKRKRFRSHMLTRRGCLAFAFPCFKVEDNIKVCALQGGRGLFLLQDAGNGAHKLICGDCFIDGFEDGKGIEVAQKLGIEEEDICII
jgi:hypothetical protein